MQTPTFSPEQAAKIRWDGHFAFEQIFPCDEVMDACMARKTTYQRICIRPLLHLGLSPTRGIALRLPQTKWARFAYQSEFFLQIDVLFY
jgi:hypothetical protein